jgi:hypothetical protein
VFDRLDLNVTGSDALTITHSECIIRNSRIRHNGGNGIKATGARVSIENCEIINAGAPTTGAEVSADRCNVIFDGASAAFVNNVTLRNGSSGIYLNLSPNAVLSGVVGYNMRGPAPRGQLVQFNNSDSGLLQDFYSYTSDLVGWCEDNVSVHASQNVIVRRGLIDGNNSPTGVGVMVEAGSVRCNVNDVDTVRMGNGAFSAYTGSTDAIFTRCRSKQQIGLDQGRGKPKSRGWNSTTRRNIAPALFVATAGVGVRWVDCSMYDIPGLASYTGGLTETAEDWTANWDAYSPPTVHDVTERNYIQRGARANTFPLWF